MPNLVGIGNSQVPTNSMLGGLAYQDSVDVEIISKIKARTSNNAKSIFVYDTRKDSDGGAWRHRTQNLSWYNEGVNERRGARKEFPSVAVIVSEDTPAYKVTIYDGDDPNLSMWMQWIYVTNDPFLDFSDPGSHHLGNYAPHSLSAANGIICVGTLRTAGALSNLNAGLREFHFIKDECFATNNDKRVKFPTSIADRNVVTIDYKQVNPNVVIRSSNVNDVAMTVLPNAPIDASTGLPVPTIAVATDGGVSVIKDDNTVISTSPSTSIIHKVEFTDDRGLNAVISNINSNNLACVYVNDIDTLNGLGYDTYNNWDGVVYKTKYDPKALTYKTASTNDTISGFIDLENRSSAISVSAAGGGLTLFEKSSKVSFDPDGGMVAFITTDYNTGYLHGDIKGAFLSDTDTTNLSGGNKVSNGSDWSGASGSQSSTPPTGWTGGNGATFAVETGNGADGNYIRLYNENNGGAGPNSYMYQAITTVVGKKYRYSATQIHRATISVYIRGGTTAGASDLFNDQFTSSSSSTPKQVFGTFTATSTTTYISLGIVSGTHNYTVGWDEIIVSETDDDRSISNNGLHSFGTINKNPVATGAELVAYSNFSSGRYLFQPYNSDLDFTDTMSIMFWVNGWVGSDSLLHRGPGATRNSKTSFHLYCTYDYNYRITFTTNGSSEQTYEIPLTANQTGWQHLCFTLSGGTVRGFLNGVEKTLSNTSFSGNIFSQATDKNGLYIGLGPVGGAADTASLALLRLSASAPSAKQVKKIYDDEKCLYHKNAKCTIQGTSDAVTGLAFDDTNGVLHVGTSSGRSEFQGLNRINNTTTAVTTAISASNEFVAEQ